MRTLSLSFALLLFSASPPSGEGLKCYVCSTRRDWRCDDRFGYEPSYLKECRPPPHVSNTSTPLCMKYKNTDSDRLERRCGWYDPEGEWEDPCEEYFYYSERGRRDKRDYIAKKAKKKLKKLGKLGRGYRYESCTLCPSHACNSGHLHTIPQIMAPLFAYLLFQSNAIRYRLHF